MAFECLQFLPFDWTSCTSFEWVFRCLSNSPYVWLLPSSNGPLRCVLRMAQVSSLGPLRLSPYSASCLIQTTQMKLQSGQLKTFFITNSECHCTRGLGLATCRTKTHHKENLFSIIMYPSNGPMNASSKGPHECAFEWAIMHIEVCTTVSKGTITQSKMTQRQPMPCGC